MVDFAALIQRGDSHRNAGRLNEALSTYKEIIELATEENETGFRARALHLAGTTLHAGIRRGTQSSYRDAITFFGEAVKTYQALGDQVGAGAVLRDSGIAADRAGDYAQAAIYYQKSLEFLQGADEPAELGITYDKLGLHFAYTNQPEAALDYINQALEIFRTSPTAGFYRATTLLDQARVFFKLKRFDEALAVAREAQGWFEAEHGSEGYAYRRAQLFGLIALVSNALGDSQTAESSTERLNRLLKTFPLETSQAIQEELESLAAEQP